MCGVDPREKLAQEFPDLVNRLKERDDCSPLHDPDVYSIMETTYNQYREDGTKAYTDDDLMQAVGWSSGKSRGRQKAEILAEEGWFSKGDRNGKNLYTTNIPPEKPSKRSTVWDVNWLPVSLDRQPIVKDPIQERLPSYGYVRSQIISKVDQAKNLGNVVSAAEPPVNPNVGHKQQADYSMKLIHIFSFLGFLSLLAGAVFPAAMATAGFFAGVSLFMSAKFLDAISTRQLLG